MKAKQTFISILLLIFIVLENLCLYYLCKQGVWTYGKNGICLFLSSVAFGIVFLYRFYNNGPLEAGAGRDRRWLTYTCIGVLLAGLAWLGTEYNAFFLKNKISLVTSDIIPLIQVACRRLMAGEYPYAMVTEFGWNENMTYLPLHWMPFCIAAILKIDARWIAAGMWAVAAVVLCVRSAKTANPVSRAAAPLLLLASNVVMFYNNDTIVNGTVELLMAGYYMLLLVSFNTSNAWLQGTLIACCLMSRYTLVLWLPLYAVVLCATGRNRQFYIATGVSIVLVLLIYVIPFMTKDPAIFANAYRYYNSAARFEWTHLKGNGEPWHLCSGTGFAYYFYTRFTGYSIPERIKLLQHTHLVVCLLVTGLMSLWFYRKRDKIDHRIFLMGSFKIYLAFFLFLIQVPYEYLMSLGNFVSVALFIEQARYRIGKPA